MDEDFDFRALQDGFVSFTLSLKFLGILLPYVNKEVLVQFLRDYINLVLVLNNLVMSSIAF